MLFLHGYDLDYPIFFYGLCFLGIGLFGAMTYGLAYLAGRLAEMHGDMWEKRLEEDKLEAESANEASD